MDIDNLVGKSLVKAKCIKDIIVLVDSDANVYIIKYEPDARFSAPILHVWGSFADLLNNKITNIKITTNRDSTNPHTHDCKWANMAICNIHGCVTVKWTAGITTTWECNLILEKL